MDSPKQKREIHLKDSLGLWRLGENLLCLSGEKNLKF